MSTRGERREQKREKRKRHMGQGKKAKLWQRIIVERAEKLRSKK